MPVLKKSEMTKPRIAWALGILCISIFPILVKLGYNSGLISAFYRMAIAFVVLLPIVLLKQKSNGNGNGRVCKWRFWLL